MLFGLLLHLVGEVQGRSADLRLAHSGTVAELGRYLEGLRAALISTLRRTLGLSLDDAEDVVQSLFAELLRNDAASFRRFQGRSSLKTWVFGNARRRAIDGFRAAQTPTEDLEDNERQTAGPREAEPDGVLERAMRSEQIRAVVDKLPPRQAKAINLFYFADQDCAQVAAALGCSAKRVTSLLADARQALRGPLARFLAEEQSG